MAIAHIDGGSGVSGDMLLGALIDAGLPLSRLKADLGALRLPPYRLSTRRVLRGALAARLVTVTPLAVPRRRPAFSDIVRSIRRSRLPPRVIKQSLTALRALYDTETALHGPGLPDALTGKELTDTLVDIVGVIAGIERLGITDVTASPINLGGGMIHPAERHPGHGPGHDAGVHGGPLPVPSPAAARLLIGFSVYSEGPAVELTTPTGAVLMRTLARASSTLPAMRLTAVGHGAGHRTLGAWPNLVRVIIGEPLQTAPTTMTADPLFPAIEDRVIQVETTIDDGNPQLYDYLRDRLFDRGALDVYLTPVIMKQGRPAIQITLLAEPARAEELTAILFDETPTLGVRLQEVRRRILPRAFARLSTPDGPVRIKIVRTPRGTELRPEFRDCRAIAERTGLPLRTVIRRIERLAERRLRTVGRFRPVRSPRRLHPKRLHRKRD